MKNENEEVRKIQKQNKENNNKSDKLCKNDKFGNSTQEDLSKMSCDKEVYHISNAHEILDSNEKKGKLSRKKMLLILPIIVASVFILFTLLMDDSSILSMKLAVYSALFVISFEISEWIDIAHKKEKKTKRDYKDKSILPLIIVFVLSCFLIALNPNHKGSLDNVSNPIILNIIHNFSDFITSISLLAFSISYFKRNKDKLEP